LDAAPIDLAKGNEDEFFLPDEVNFRLNLSEMSKQLELNRVSDTAEFLLLASFGPKTFLEEQ
jgi:hypothetical protein